MRASDPPTEDSHERSGPGSPHEDNSHQHSLLVEAMRKYVARPDGDVRHLILLQHRLADYVGATATRARSYSSEASSSFAPSTRELEASSASSRGKLPLNEEQVDEVVARFRATTGRAKVTKALRGLLAARARDVGYGELIRRFELRFAARQDSENLLTGIERDDWDADLPTRPEHQRVVAPTFDGDLPDGSAPAPTDDRPFAERMAAHNLRREDL